MKQLCLATLVQISRICDIKLENYEVYESIY